MGYAKVYVGHITKIIAFQVFHYNANISVNIPILNPFCPLNHERNVYKTLVFFIIIV